MLAKSIRVFHLVRIPMQMTTVAARKKPTTRQQYSAHYLHFLEISTLVINVGTCFTYAGSAAIKQAIE
jgi:hypothetical protein